jgi:HEAT repeat protein
MRLAQDADSDVRYEALHALAQIRDPKAVATFIAVAKADSDRRIRILAVDLLSNFGPDAREAIPFLMDIMRTELLALQKEPPEFSLAATEALASIGVPAVQPVAKVLSNKVNSSVLRQTAAQILSRIATHLGPDAIKSSLPALIDVLTDADQDVRLQSALTIRHLGQHAKPALGILKGRLRNSSGRERVIMTGTIRRIEPSNPEVIDVLISELRAREAGTRYLAGLELSEVPSLGENAVDALIAAMSDRNKDVRLVAIKALRQVSPCHSRSRGSVVK